jgi:hypothetical protein
MRKVIFHLSFVDNTVALIIDSAMTASLPVNILSMEFKPAFRMIRPIAVFKPMGKLTLVNAEWIFESC